jgi:DNA-binding transcriptional LysR family regulator
METLSNLESFVRSAEAGSFSEAARRLGLTPAAVSKNVARLEAGLQVRLFQRSTRKLTLTEAGERFLGAVRGGIETIQGAIANVSGDGEPEGTLRVSVPYGFGLGYVLPMLDGFCAKYPKITPDWDFDNRTVDLIAEGFDAAIGGGFELSPGVTARELGRAHVVAVASPAFMKGKKKPAHPSGLAELDGVVRRSARTGRIVTLALRNAKTGEEFTPVQKTRIVLNDAQALVEGAAMGLGVALAVMPHALPLIKAGRLVRLLPDWYADTGGISICFPGGRLVAPKTRAFVDYTVEYFRKEKLAQRVSAA